MRRLYGTSSITEITLVALTTSLGKLLVSSDGQGPGAKVHKVPAFTDIVDGT